jgi:hypothetical protein
MKKLMGVLQIAVFTIGLSGIVLSSPLCAETISVLKVQPLIVEKGAANYTVMVKAFVKNSGDPDDITVEINALDINGYVLETTSLNGYVKQNQTKVLVGLVKMSKAVYHEIVIWEWKH